MSKVKFTIFENLVKVSLEGVTATQIKDVFNYKPEATKLFADEKKQDCIFCIGLVDNVNVTSLGQYGATIADKDGELKMLLNIPSAVKKEERKEYVIKTYAKEIVNLEKVMGQITVAAAEATALRESVEKNVVIAEA